MAYALWLWLPALAEGSTEPPLRQIYAIGVPLLYFFLLLMIYPELRARQLLNEQDAIACANGDTISSKSKAERVLGFSRRGRNEEELRAERRRSALVLLAAQVSQRLHLMEALHFLWEDYEVCVAL